MSDEVIVHVAAGVIFDREGRVLLAQRPPGKVYTGYWEFPGGKLEPGESARTALERELREELGLTVVRAAPWLRQRFVYPHAHVELHFFRVLAFTGEPVGHDGQAFAWQTIERFTVGPLLPANTFVLRALALPRHYGISMAEDVGETAFLEHAQRAMAAGLRLVQVRDKTWPEARRRALTERLLEIAAAFGARVLVNGSAEDARAWGAHGVHWSAAMLAAAQARPADMLCAASCHTHADVRRAGELGLDFAVLGPVAPTPSHPQAPHLGWSGFGAGVEGTQVPVFALGGLAPRDFDAALDAGAHGIPCAAAHGKPNPA